MAEITYHRFHFKPLQIRRQTVTPSIHLYEVRDARGARLSYAGNNASHLARLRAIRAFNLPPNLNFCGDIFRNTWILPDDWFFPGNDTDQLFHREMARYPQSQTILSTNAGNAPLHDWEVNYDKNQIAPLASKDFETPGRPLSQRKYYCVTYGPNNGVEIKYVRFSNEGQPLDPAVETAIGGRPLVHQGNPTPLEEVLATSLTDPRHVILLPEINLEKGIFMPLGIRSVQQMIRDEKAVEIIERIKTGEPLLIDLEMEKACCGNIAPDQISSALALYGYSKDNFELSEGALYIKLKYNPYRHTFWAQTGDSFFIGIINNDLKPNDGSIDGSLYKRVLKAVGLTIPRLQAFLTGGLKVEEAVLMGNGKDPRIYYSEAPHGKNEIRRLHDNDVEVQRSCITSGMVSLII